MARQFTPRTKAPATTNKYYIHKSKGGLGETILINGNSVLPNCVGFCWSRAFECWGVKPKLSKGNAEDWWAYKDGYKRGSTPRLGAIICWRKGKAGYGKDGAGHVGFVEKVNKDGSILVSQSNYSGTRFFTATIKKPYAYGVGLTFQGFIYPPVNFAPAKPKSGFKIKNADFPKSIKKGKYFTIRGTIESALPMKRVEVGIVGSNGKYMFHYDYRKVNGAKAFDIHNADGVMLFRKLPKGTYYYRIWAHDENGAHKIHDNQFTVK